MYEFDPRDLVARVGGREDIAQIGAQFVKAGNDSERGNTGESEVSVVGILHQWTNHSQWHAVHLGEAQQKWLQAGKAAGQRGKVWAAANRIDIDVEGDAATLGLIEVLYVLCRAGEGSLLSAEEG